MSAIAEPLDPERAGGGPKGSLHVVLASDFFHPVIGGAEHQVRLLAAALQARGHRVSVVTTRQPGHPDHDRVDGVEVRRLPSLAAMLPTAGDDRKRRFLPPAPDPRLVLGLRGVLRSGDAPDLVHANGWIAYSCAAALEGSEAPMVISVRDYGYACAVRSLLQDGERICSGPSLGKCLECAGRHYGAPKALAAVGGVFSGRPLLARHVTGVHSVSRFVQSIVERDVLHEDPGWQPHLERIPDIVPGPELPALTAEQEHILERLPSEPFILFVGVLQRHKGVHDLLAAYARLRDARAEAPPLVLIGSRHADTPATFPDGATVLHDLPHPVVMAAWERSLFGLAPSVWPDPLPGVVREAMSRGRPVIATEVGGNPDMVTDGETGLLVPPGDPMALAAAMNRLLEDPAWREQLGANAKASVRYLTPDGVAARFERFYATAVAAR